MNWESLSAFIEMGGYGRYVWGSYLVTFALLAVEVVLLRKRRLALPKSVQESKPS